MRPPWACEKWGTWGHDMPDCPVCRPAFIAHQIATAPKTDHFYEMYVKFKKTGYFVYYRSAVDLPWEDVPEAAVKDGMLGKFHLYDVDYVMEITPKEYFAQNWE